MNLSHRNKILLIIILALTLVNVAAVLTFVYHTRFAGRNAIDIMPGEQSDSTRLQRGPAFLIREMGFDAAQQEQFHQSRINFRKASKPAFVEMRNLNAAIVEEVSKENPDTIALRQMSVQAGVLHGQVKLNTIRHLREVRSIATPEQQKKLDFLYRELISHDGDQLGKGNQHRHRRGQNPPPAE